MEFGLSSYINATKRKVIWEIHEYLKVFRQTFYKHCSCETEINIKEQNIDDEGWRRINMLKVESESLDFKKNLDFILNKWNLAMNGQPQPYREIPISTLINREIFEKVHNFIAILQEETLREKKHLENLECNKKCSEGPKIFNFTEHQLDKEISKQLRNGLGYVPHSKETRAAIKIRIENEIKDAAIG